MKSFWPWIIGFLVLLVICACMQVGWLYSILTIGVVGGILCGIYVLQKKAIKKDATEWDEKLVNVLSKAVIVISACLIFFGVVLGGIGLFNPDIEYYADGEICSWCGGDGKYNGKQCSLCDGWGFIATNEYTYANHTWIGILMAAAGAVLGIGTAVIKDIKVDDKEEFETDEHTMHVNTETATLSMSFGHWVSDKSRNIWIANQPDDSGAWSIRCNIKYLHKKPAILMMLIVVPYDINGSKIENFKLIKFRDDYFQNYTNTITWKNLWPNKQLGRIEIKETNIYFKDGTNQTIRHE